MPTVREQVEELRKLGRDAYLKQATAPVLVELPAGSIEGVEAVLTKPLSGPLMRATVEASGAVSPRSKQVADDAVMHYVRKRPKGAFAERIGVGRTANNDIVLPYAGVSKYHAYFTKGAEGWCLSDAGSRNGTFAEREPVGAAAAKPLDDEALVQIGPHFFLFLTPPALVAFLESR